MYAAISHQPSAISHQLSVKRSFPKKTAFTLVELISTIAILAVLATMATFFTLSYIDWAHKTANNTSLESLNKALQLYKTLGGMTLAHSLEGLNSYGKIQAVYNALQNGFTVGGQKRSFINQGATLPISELYATGSGQSFTFCGLGSSTNTATIGGTYVAQYVPPPAFAELQRYNNTGRTTSSDTITLTAPVSVGSRLVVILINSSFSSITDSAGNSWSRDFATQTDYLGHNEIWSCPITHALNSGDTITLNYNSYGWNTSRGALLSLQNTTGLDGTFTGHGYIGISGSTISVPGTLTHSPTICVGFVTVNYSSSYTPSWNQSGSPIMYGADNGQKHIFYSSQSTSGTKDPGGTIVTPGGCNFDCVWAAYY